MGSGSLWNWSTVHLFRSTICLLSIKFLIRQFVGKEWGARKAFSGASATAVGLQLENICFKNKMNQTALKSRCCLNQAICADDTYDMHDPVLLQTALLLSTIIVDPSRPEPGRRWGPGFHPQVIDDMSLRERGWCMLRVGHNVSLHPVKPTSNWWIVTEPVLLNQTRDPSLHKTLGKRRCVFITRHLWHEPHSLREALFYRRRLYWSMTAV